MTCGHCKSEIESIAEEVRRGTSGGYCIEFRWCPECGSLTQLGAYGNTGHKSVRVSRRALQTQKGRLAIAVDVAVAVTNEREECAKLAESHFDGDDSVGFLISGGVQIAHAIRQRPKV